MKNVKYAQCVKCGKIYEATPNLTNCQCGGILDIIYDYDYIKTVLTKEKLLLKVWGYESDAEDNNVEVYISFLRKKLEHLHSQVKIRTIRMVGYCLEPPEAEPSAQ